ncbi:N-acetylmuramoyl-L-alanine amidase [Clostridium sp. BJN0001]|uniref:N-acetylmuramoyl-L-alanine amidase family protein n=1 Tax=Clostridium sp. BJN0001 TaxID=2930219 RepID=UPI001FD35F28|nr:N-acetylmuramoyl-L-alanine amidase [Clostridium sp. BJN0001]
MKRVIAFLMTVMFAFMMIGCNQKQEDTTETQSSSEETTVANINEDNPKPSTEEPKKEENDKKSEKNNPSKRVIVIDPGHGVNGNKGMEKQSPDSNKMKIKDPGGAQGNTTGTPEYRVNLKVALKLKNLLEQNGMTVVMTKNTEKEAPGNIERAEVGNKNNAALEIRIHCDSSTNSKASGASMLVPDEIGYVKNAASLSNRYGETILNTVVSEVGMHNRGVVKRNDMTGFNWSKVPVVLIEMGFMSNTTEDKLLSTDNYQNKLAKGLCDGIIKCFA